MTYSPAMLRALQIEPKYADTPGNIAARAYHLAQTGGLGGSNFAQGDGLVGINLGWSDQQASTDFLTSIVDAIDEAYQDGTLDEDRIFEIADSAVPVGTYLRLMVCSELGAYDLEDEGLAPSSGGLAELSGAILCEIASSTASQLTAVLQYNDATGDELGEMLQELGIIPTEGAEK